MNDEEDTATQLSVTEETAEIRALMQKELGIFEEEKVDPYVQSMGSAEKRGLTRPGKQDVCALDLGKELQVMTCRRVS